MAKLVYIAGYGRSGSTVLGTILGNHSELQHVGEVSHLLSYWSNSRRICSCGQPYQRCDFWKDLPFVDCSPEVLLKCVRRVERSTSLPRLALNLIGEKEIQRYRGFQDGLFDYVLSRSGKTMIVDSSKSAWLTVGRFEALRKFSSYDIYVIHLVRNGLSVMESQVVAGDNRVLEGLIDSVKWPGLRTCLGWIHANVCVHLLSRNLAKGRYMLLRYEDFIADSKTHLERIGDFCGFDARYLIDKVDKSEDFSIGHVTGGNRLRFTESIELRHHFKNKPGTSLPSRYKVLFCVLAGWLQKLYGYSC